MCIRDRHGEEAAALTGKPRAAERRDVYRRDVRGTGTRGYGCLLYTSDAADERFRVDFGGRRSIKKKTKKRTDGTREHPLQ